MKYENFVSLLLEIHFIFSVTNNSSIVHSFGILAFTNERPMEDLSGPRISELPAIWPKVATCRH